jgi:hypothetical protein
LKSGGSSLMLETAIWPVSPSSNSTTTESRSSSSSLEVPAEGVCPEHTAVCWVGRRGVGGGKDGGADWDIAVP